MKNLLKYLVVIFGILGLTEIMIFSYSFYRAKYICPNSCFIKEERAWCELDCWNLMTKFNTTPDYNTLPTECEKYPNLKWCYERKN